MDSTHGGSNAIHVPSYKV